jgi:hypothetical protein
MERHRLYNCRVRAQAKNRARNVHESTEFSRPLASWTKTRGELSSYCDFSEATILACILIGRRLVRYNSCCIFHRNGRPEALPSHSIKSEPEPGSEQGCPLASLTITCTAVIDCPWGLVTVPATEAAMATAEMLTPNPIANKTETFPMLDRTEYVSTGAFRRLRQQ